MNRNYQKELDKMLKNMESNTTKPTLLLHSCCAPCSSYVLEYLVPYFKITVFFYNPNITKEEEYQKRIREVERLIKEMGLTDVSLTEGRYDPQEFLLMAKKWPGEKEGGKRCLDCYRMRIFETAKTAAEGKYDYFTSTLSISPHKNAWWLNELSEEAANLYQIKTIPSDFKKKNGYKRSIELSREYDLYRQDYCGCIFSKIEREMERERMGGQQ